MLLLYNISINIFIQLLFSVPDKTYVSTFHATGCPNPDPFIDWWKTVPDGQVFEDMMAYCTLVREGQADSIQIRQCCGSTVCIPTSCNMMTKWNEGNKNFQAKNKIIYFH